LKKCLIETEITNQKRVIFFDELPWLASARSNFLEALGYWWNDWASQQNLIVVLCGSAASWMLKKVVHHTGGLHNRVTKKINLKPFTLWETRLFLESINVLWDNYQIIQFYMAVGGIPTYLQEAQQGETVTQTINRTLLLLSVSSLTTGARVVSEDSDHGKYLFQLIKIPSSSFLHLPKFTKRYSPLCLYLIKIP